MAIVMLKASLLGRQKTVIACVLGVTTTSGWMCAVAQADVSKGWEGDVSIWGGSHSWRQGGVGKGEVREVGSQELPVASFTADGLFLLGFREKT